MAALVMLALAACGDGPTEGRPGPGPGPVPPDSTPAVASVEIDPGTVQLPEGGSRALLVTLRSRNGAVLPWRPLQWASSDSTVVRVDINGNVTALRPGTSVVTAATGGVQGQATVQVMGPPPVAHVVVTSGAAEIEPGDSRPLGVQLRAADGTVLYNRPVTWSSSDSSVIRVFQDGLVLGMKGGTATITATSEGKSGSVTLVIPDWIVFDLRSLNGAGVPAVTELSADTTFRGEDAMVVDEYRQRISWGRIWFSTLDSRYRQRYVVETWKRSVSYLQGNTITGPEQMVSSRYQNDEGRATMYDMWTGEPIYESTFYAGHSFRAYRREGGGRLIHQRIPSTSEAGFDMVFAK